MSGAITRRCRATTLCTAARRGQRQQNRLTSSASPSARARSKRANRSGDKPQTKYPGNTPSCSPISSFVILHQKVAVMRGQRSACRPGAYCGLRMGLEIGQIDDRRAVVQTVDLLFVRLRCRVPIAVDQTWRPLKARRPRRQLAHPTCGPATGQTPPRTPPPTPPAAAPHTAAADWPSSAPPETAESPAGTATPPPD
jgi:hypothetical protein